MKTIHYFLLIFMFGLWLSSCVNGMDPVQDSPLDNKSYILVALDGSSPLVAAKPTIEFENGQVSGYTGCNAFGGSYEVTDNLITFSDLYQTEMACMEPDTIMAQEKTYLEILSNVTTFWLESEQLTLVDDNMRTLVFMGTSVPVTPESDEVAAEIVSVTNEPVPPSQPTIAPPEGFKLIQDDMTGIGVYIPDSWVVSAEFPGDYFIFQSYPVDKYIGGEARESGDTKCDFTIQPENTDPVALIQQWESDPMTSFTSLETVELQSGGLVQRIEVESMGTSLVYVFDFEPQVITLTCFGDFSLVDQIASTVHLVGVE